ncbi:MAG TPA: hypothetical protein PK158_00010 [Spirochaetota bacterium]|nr:hypothetical protein [Spirochaetota bacterium]
MDDSMVPKDVAYFRKKVLSRGGKWSDNGVNVVAIRDSSAPAKIRQQKADDLFVVFDRNKVQGYFRGTTEPGVERWTDENGKTSEQIGGVAHLVPGDYTYKKEAPLSGNAARSKGYFNSVGSVPVWRDKNKDGKIDSEEKAISEKAKHSSIDIQQHWMGDLPNIEGYSQGCQGIKGRSYMGPRGNIVNIEVSKNIFGNYNRLGAYEAYIQQAGSKGTMEYHLFDKSDIDQKKFNQSEKLNYIPEN